MRQRLFRHIISVDVKGQLVPFQIKIPQDVKQIEGIQITSTAWQKANMNCSNLKSYRERFELFQTLMYNVFAEKSEHLQAYYRCKEEVECKRLEAQRAESRWHEERFEPKRRQLMYEWYEMLYEIDRLSEYCEMLYRDVERVDQRALPFRKFLSDLQIAIIQRESRCVGVAKKVGALNLFRAETSQEFFSEMIQSPMESNFTWFDFQRDFDHRLNNSGIHPNNDFFCQLTLGCNTIIKGVFEDHFMRDTNLISPYQVMLTFKLIY